MTDPLASIDGDAVGFTPEESGSSPERGSLYLIAHKVRGEPAFDVATPMDMADGRWWIIPTSGHRAYPYWTIRLNLEDNEIWMIPPLPDGLRDHYTTSAPAPPPIQRPKVPTLEDI